MRQPTSLPEEGRAGLVPAHSAEHPQNAPRGERKQENTHTSEEGAAPSLLQRPDCAWTTARRVGQADTERADASSLGRSSPCLNACKHTSAPARMPVASGAQMLGRLLRTGILCILWAGRGSHIALPFTVEIFMLHRGQLGGGRGRGGSGGERDAPSTHPEDNQSARPQPPSNHLRILSEVPARLLVSSHVPSCSFP